MKMKKDESTTVSTYDLNSGDFLHEYVLSEKETATLLINERDDTGGTVETTVSYYQDLGVEPE